MLNDDCRIALCRDELAAGRWLGLRVRGTSMIPALWPGDAIRVERANAQVLQPGMVVVFGRHGQLVAHRIIATRHGAGGVTLVTRGDAQRGADPPVGLAEIVGAVTAVRRFGRERPVAPQGPAGMRHLARWVRGWQGARVRLGGARARLTRALAPWLCPRTPSGTSR